MKAWIVNDEYDEYSTVVFAETRNQAKIAAMTTDTCCDTVYLDIRPLRFKEADEMYRGKIEMDWSDDDDRRFLVEHGWYCIDTDFCNCVNCSSADICEMYHEHVRAEMEK